ncbi:MAG: hypothetical protein LC714_09505 [Actinobacteria bacterium]|nr:hypothetical protein [Actinomycetota bacterium]
MRRFPDELEKILAAVASGALSPSAAAGHLKSGEVRYLDEFAVLDSGRATRKGVPEVVYAPGKTPEQLARICETLLASGQRVVVSATSPEVTAEIRHSLPGVPVRSAGRAVVVGSGEPAPSGGRVGAISAGTSDLPVLEEAVAVAREMGAEVRSFHDVGVAGLQSCSPGLSVVNVDNGVGAGATAALIANRAALGRAGEVRENVAEPGSA